MKATVVVNSEEEFETTLEKFYADSKLREEYSQNCKSVFDRNHGAIEYVLERI